MPCHLEMAVPLQVRYRDNVVGGPGAFVIVAENFNSFGQAILNKLIAEIAANPYPKQAQLHLKVFAPVLAVDQGQSFVGSPAFTVPILGFVIPEIALFKNASHSGHAEVEVFTIDGSTGKFVDKSPPAVGETNYNDYTVLIVVHFTRSDMETRKWDWQPGS